MSDLADTPDLTVHYCPGCEPERDPMREILAVRWCHTHEPGRTGLDDGGVTAGFVDTGTFSREAVAKSCVAIQELITKSKGAAE